MQRAKLGSRFAAKLMPSFFLFVHGCTGAQALNGATVDSADRYPFVVEVKLNGKLICSGTVLYPRLVVTAAHCLQEKHSWHGREFYAETYLESAALSISNVRSGASESYAVAETVISPEWHVLVKKNSARRFSRDLALIVTKEPMAIGAPLSTLNLLDAGAAFPTDWHRDRAVLVGFGGPHCSPAAKCDDAGIRRAVSVAIKHDSHCLKGGADREAGGLAEVLCVDTGVMPGDSGGPLLIEAKDGQLYFAGVISAQRALPPEIAARSKWQRSLAATLSANQPFISAKAKELGYAP
jgi:hypothetical protein